MVERKYISAYENDVIDAYEKQRKTEHMGTRLENANVYDEYARINPKILVTQMELANELSFSGSFSDIQVNEKGKVSSGFITDLFSNYSETDSQDEPVRAIRVWSGNHHWLLTKESANIYLRVVPVNTTISSSTEFSLVYFTGTDSEFTAEFSTGSQPKKRYSYLLHNGNATSSGGSSSAQFTVSASSQTEGDNAPNVSFQDGHSKMESNDTSIVIPGRWDDISYAYLVTAPKHSKFALGTDDLIIPLYGGTIRIVFKDKSTYDISTYTKLSYFYTLKELREYYMPDLEVAESSNAFDWTATGGHNERHVPLLIVNPSNTSKRKRVLDSLDAAESNEQRDKYSVTIGSNTMFEPTVPDGYAILSYPAKLDISFNDTEINIGGMRVAKITPGTYTKYYSADDGTLYVKEKAIDDSELCLSSLDRVIERDVYAIDRNDESATGVKITTIKFPVVIPKIADIVTNANISTKEIQDAAIAGNEEKVVEETKKALFTAELTFGANETTTTTLARWETLHGQNGFLDKITPWIHGGMQLAPHLAKLPIVQRFANTKVGSFLFRLGSMVPKVIRNDESQVVSPSEAILDITSHYTPPLPQDLREILKNSPNKKFSWNEIIGAIKKLGARLVRGFRRFIRKVSPVHQLSIGRGINKQLPSSSNVYDSATEWQNVNVAPIPEDIVIEGYDGSSTADTMPIKVYTQGQQQKVMLHHPQSTSANGLVGIRMVTPPQSMQIPYGDQDVASALKGATFCAVDSNNKDVPLPSGHWLGNRTTPYLTIENGGIIAIPIRYSPGVINGQIDVAVQASESAILAFRRAGLHVSEHLCSEEYPNGFLDGFLSLINRGRRFLAEHPIVNEIAKRGVSWAAGKVMQLANPQPKTDDENDDTPDQEPEVVLEAPASCAIPPSEDVDKTVENELKNATAALYFDGDFPEGNAITLTSIDKFFKETKVATLGYDDVDYNTGTTTNTSFDRNYLADGSFEPPLSLARDILEFGNGILTWSGISFSIARSAMIPGSTNDSKLVLVSPPSKTIYAFGDRQMDLSGAIWRLEGADGTILIDNLSSDNVLCEPLPDNIEEMVLEEPTSDDDKTTIRVSFFGYTNDDIKVSLICPTILAMGEKEKYGSLSLRMARLLLARVTSCDLAPVRLNMLGRVMNGTSNATSWPSSSYDLLKGLKCNVVLSDNLMRRKTFPVSGMSQTIFNKLFKVKNYDPSELNSSGVKTTTIDIECMEYQLTDKVVTLDEIEYATEDAIQENPTNPTTTTTPPTDFPYSPEVGSDTGFTGEGVTYSMKEADSQGCLLYEAMSVHVQHINEIRLRIARESRGMVTYKPMECTLKAIAGDRLYLRGNSGIGSFFQSPSTNNLHSMVLQDSGLRHHMVGGKVKNFFKKLWKGIKRGAKWIWSKVKGVANFIKKEIWPPVKEALPGLIQGAATMATMIGSPQAVSSVGDEVGDEASIPWRGLKLFTKGTGTARKAYYGYGQGRRHMGGFLTRNPWAIPGSGPFVIGRRYPEVYPSAFASAIPSDETESKIDVIEVVGAAVRDNDMNIATDETISELDFDVLAFACPDLCLGDNWPSVEEVQQLINVYGQIVSDIQNKWTQIPGNLKAVSISNYSCIDDNKQQMIFVTVKAKNTHTLRCLVYLRGSSLTPMDSSDQQFISFLNSTTYSPYNIVIAYKFDNRYGAVKTVGGDFKDEYSKLSDTQYILTTSNRSVLSVIPTGTDNNNTEWDDNTGANIVTAYYTIAGTDQSGNIGSEKITVYRFKYTVEVTGDYMEVVEYKKAEHLFKTKEDVILYQDPNTGEFKVTGYDGKRKANAPKADTFKKLVKIVDHFST